MASRHICHDTPPLERSALIYTNGSLGRNKKRNRWGMPLEIAVAPGCFAREGKASERFLAPLRFARSRRTVRDANGANDVGGGRIGEMWLGRRARHAVPLHGVDCNEGAGGR